MKRIRREYVFGGTGSVGSTGIVGVTGSVGIPGSAGLPPDSKEVIILCIKDSGFFKQGEYYKVLIHDSDPSGGNPWKRITITSIDKLDTKVYKPDEFEDIFLHGDKLRDKKITEILNDTI
jgi:hypothetical protein